MKAEQACAAVQQTATDTIMLRPGQAVAEDKLEHATRESLQRLWEGENDGSSGKVERCTSAGVPKSIQDILNSAFATIPVSTFPVPPTGRCKSSKLQIVSVSCLF